MTVLYRYLTATNTDVLSGTELDPPEFTGTLLIWAFSDNDTATLAVNQFGFKSGVTNIIPITDSNAKPDIRKQIPTKVAVSKGLKPVVVVGGTVSKVWLIFQLVNNQQANTTVMCKYFSATNSDIFGGTVLDTPVKSGTLLLYSASDTVTSTLEALQAGHKVGKTTLIPYTDADASIDVSTQIPIVLPVQAGVKPLVSLGGAVTEVYIFGVLV